VGSGDHKRGAQPAVATSILHDAPVTVAVKWAGGPHATSDTLRLPVASA
jgi:hypothetical protein